MPEFTKPAVRAVAVVVLWLACAGAAAAAPFAAMVMDARTGKVLYARNADTRLYPASLTKMMTLYVTFDAIRRGEISLDTVVRVSRNAAAEPPSRLGLKAGQRIRLRYLIRAAAVKSANDAATAIAEAVGGSEAAFVRRMNRMAKALGMTRTTFRNAHGLTAKGHLSTARDMTVLGRHLIYDFPQYYNLFSRRSTDAGLATVRNTNRRFLDSYRGADGIKTGYTAAAGFNLVASAKRGNKRIIATVFGGRSATSRNRKVAELLDLGFARAPDSAPVSRPTIAMAALQGGAPTRSLRPRPRPAAGAGSALLAEAIGDAVEEAVAAAEPETTRAEAPALTEVLAIPIPRLRPRAGEAAGPVVVRASTSDKRLWSVNLGRFANRTAAEKHLLRTALAELELFDGALRKVVSRGGQYEANFVGLTKDTALRACARLAAREVPCVAVAPPSS